MEVTDHVYITVNGVTMHITIESWLQPGEVTADIRNRDYPQEAAQAAGALEDVQDALIELDESDEEDD